MTAEQWLHTAVEQIDKHVFSFDLGTATHDFQIYYGRIKGKKGTETVQPSDTEQVTMDDFFPTTIGIDYQTRDTKVLMNNLAYECIKAFLGVTKGKALKKTCQKYYFDAPFNASNPSPYCQDLINDALNETIKLCGEFPWKPIKFPVKEQKEKKSSKIIFFCPECGMEYNVSRSKFEKMKINGTPTCICGAKCGRDLTDELSDSTEAQEDSKD